MPRRFDYIECHKGDKQSVFKGGVLIGQDLAFGNVIFGTMLIKGRVSTGTVAGAALEIDATTYQYSEGQELRYTVTDWSDTYTITSFSAQYIRAQNEEANASGSIYGQIVYGVSNAVNTQYVWGALFYAYCKGTANTTIDSMYAVQPELSWDASANTNTLTTEAICVRAKITGGKVDDYTKIHGYQLIAGDMNGASPTYGNAFWILDDSGMSGTIAWTTGINIAANCTTAISIAGTNERAIDCGSMTAGTTTDGVIMRVGTGIGASAMAMATDGMRGFALYMRNTGAGTSITGVRLRCVADPASGSASIDTLHVQTSCISGKDAATLNSAFIELIPKGTNTITTGRVLLLNADSAASQTMTTQIIAHMRVHTRGDETITNDEMLRLENEAVGGNGRQLDSWINLTTTSLSGGIKAAAYLIDAGSATDALATAVLRIGSDGTAVNASADGMFRDPESQTEAGYMLIDVGGTTYEVPFYASS